MPKTENSAPKTEKDIQIQFRIGLAFRTIILANKTLVKQRTDLKNDSIPDDSYGKLSSTTGIRAASISDIVNGKSNPKGLTVMALLEALGASVAKFGKIYDDIKPDQLQKYIAAVGKKKQPSKKKKIKNR